MRITSTRPTSCSSAAARSSASTTSCRRRTASARGREVPAGRDDSRTRTRLVNAPDDVRDTVFGPWNPGLHSQVPRAIAHLATIYRPENAFTRLSDVRELADLTGLRAAELVVFRPERLALHEVLVRVMADFSVPDGPKIEDLGINFRAIVRTIMVRHIEPRMEVLSREYDKARSELAAKVTTELAALIRIAAASAPPPRSWLATVFGKQVPAPAADESE